MTTTTSNQGLTLPVPADGNNVPSHMGLYNAGVENRLVQRYLNTADRTLRNPSPNKGELSYLSTEDRYETYNGTSWVGLYAAGPWTTYTPTWGITSGVAPNIGNGTIIGRYQQIGKTVHLHVKLQMGSTTTYGGTGQWTLSLPVNSVLGTNPILPGRTFDSSAPNNWLAVAHLSTGTTMQLETQAAAGDTDIMTQGQPVTFASGDFVVIQGTYEAQ